MQQRNGVVCVGSAEELKRRQWVNQIRSIKESVKDFSVEAKEFPLLEAVIREWLVKTQQAGKYLAGAVVGCEVW
jgi:hypothetical protein